jgi:hypothetical protein
MVLKPNILRNFVYMYIFKPFFVLLQCGQQMHSLQKQYTSCVLLSLIWQSLFVSCLELSFPTYNNFYVFLHDGLYYVSAWLGYSAQFFLSNTNLEVAVKVFCKCG